MLDWLCEAQDRFNAIRREYFAGTVTYETFREAAITLLTIRRDAEIATYGKAKTQVNSVSIARMMRG